MAVDSLNHEMLREKFYEDPKFAQDSIRMVELDAKGKVMWEVLDLDAEVARINGSKSNTGRQFDDRGVLV